MLSLCWLTADSPVYAITYSSGTASWLEWLLLTEIHECKFGGGSVTSIWPVPAGNQIQQDLRARLPPSFSLDLQIVNRQRKSMEVEITLKRIEAEVKCSQPGLLQAQAGGLHAASTGGHSGGDNHECSTAHTYAMLVVGSSHNDRLLCSTSILLESFLSPFTVRASLL